MKVTQPNKVLKTGTPSFQEKNVISPEGDAAKKGGMMDKGMFSEDKLTGSMQAAPEGAKKMANMVNKSVESVKPNEMWPTNA